MVFIVNPLMNRSLALTKKALLFYMYGTGKKYVGKLQFPEINMLMNKFVRKGHKACIQEAFFKIFFILKFCLSMSHIGPILSLTILFFSPTYTTARLSKRKGKKRKKFERLLFKRMITSSRGVKLATRFVYKAIQAERKKSKCNLIFAGVIEIFRLLRTPTESLTFAEYKAYIDSYAEKKLLRFDYKEIKKEKKKMKISSLTFSKANCNGRNARGQIVIRFRRSINNRRAIFDRYRSLIKVKSYVIQRRLKEIRLMYHPFNVLSNILSFEQGFVGNKIQAYNKQVNIMWVGDSNCLGNFRIKDRIHCAGIKYGRASGCFLTIYRKIKIKKNLYVGLVLPSGVKRYLQSTARATLGILAGGFKRMQHIGSAGNNFSLGRRPRVRGVAMNPIDHPHGGGEGKTSGGRHPVSKWGKLTKGKKTVLKKRNAFGLET